MKNLFKLPIYVGIILQKESKVLLIQRCNTDWMSGYWNFPGGLLEENETLATAAAREIFEETDAIVQPYDFNLTHVLHVRANKQNTKDILGIYFTSRSWKNIPINKEPHKHSALEWFEINNLPTQITEHALLAIQSIKTTDKHYSENG